jgi:hypothetical protein
MFPLVAPRQCQVIVWRLPRFLDESVQQNHPTFPVDVEQHPRNSVFRQVRPNFIQAITQGLAHRHSDRPAEFCRLNVLSNALPIFGRKRFQPVSYRFSASFRAKEERWDSFALLPSRFIVRIFSQVDLAFCSSVP